MTTSERQKKAKEQGLIVNIGKKVTSKHSLAFRSGDTAEIIGWGFRSEDDRHIYFIKFDNDECDAIPAGRLFEESGFVFMD